MHGERGVALLEVIVALAILSVAGLSLAEAVREQARAFGDLAERRALLVPAEQVLTRLSLRDRNGLDIRLGRRVEGRFITDVQRPRPTLYRLAVADSAAPGEELLVTAVYRPEGP